MACGLKTDAKLPEFTPLPPLTKDPLPINLFGLLHVFGIAPIGDIPLVRIYSHFPLIDCSTPFIDTASLPTFHPCANTQLPDLITTSPGQTLVSPHVIKRIDLVISRL